MISPEIKKTLCPFCGFGCELGVMIDDLGIRGVEYPKDTANAGRLCPRGSAAALYMDHPQRLTQPLKNGHPVKWDKINRDVLKMVAEPEQVAVVFDRNITDEEYHAIASFCRARSIEQYASAYVESESVLASLIRKQPAFSLDRITKAQVVCVVGDIFNQSPMISKEIIAWRLRDRKNRLIVIDALRTHTAAFATDFLKTRIGAEPLVLLSLAGARVFDRNVDDLTGIPAASLDNISQLMKDRRDGLILAAVPMGRSYDDTLWTEGLSLLRDHSGMELVPLYEFAGHAGSVDLAVIINRIKAKKIKHLLCLGELFPYHYPQLARDLRGVNMIAATPMRFDTHTAIPAALNLEKAGTVTTIFGKKQFNGELPVPSGARSIAELLGMWGGTGHAEEKTPVEPRRNTDIKARVGQAIERGYEKKKKVFRLVSEKRAYCFCSFFEPETLKLHPQDAASLRIRIGDTVVIESSQSKQSLPAKLSYDADPGVVVVSAETPATRGLFDYWIDDSTVRFVPTEVKIWRKE